MNFFDKLNRAIAQHQSLLSVDLSPSLDPEQMGHQPWPFAIAQPPQDSPAVQKFRSQLHPLIAQTSSLVCAYTLNLEAYRGLGPTGLELLCEVLQAIPPEIPTLLDAKHADLSTSTLMAALAFETLQVDAITLSPYAGQDQVAPFLVYPDKAVLILCATENPSASVLQHYPSPEEPFYLHLVREAKTWGTPDQVALETSTGSPEVLQRIRAIAPERMIWLNGRWHDLDWQATLQNGLNHNGEGLVLSVPADLAQAELLQPLRDALNQVRAQKTAESPVCPVWMPNVCLLQQHPYEDLILQLYDIGCLRFGRDFVQASGATFPYYIDLRVIISNPQVFDAVLNAYASILQGLVFDRLAGIPYGALPTATGLSLRLNKPMIYPRKEVKAHGAKRLIEGYYSPGERVALVDDVFISGKSALEGAAKLASVGLEVQDIVVLIDHEKGVKERILKQGYRPYAVLTLSAIANTLHEAGRIDEQQKDLLLRDHSTL